MVHDTPSLESDSGDGAAADAKASAQTGTDSDKAGGANIRVALDSVAIGRALMRIAHEIVERNEDLASLYLVGVPNGGVPLARSIARNLAQIADLDPVVGILDTTLYRDDLVSSGARPRLRRTEMPSAVDARAVILVDDVANTGRTIRAAMDALMDFGRPGSVQVVALVDRGHRELPIRIDYVGKNIPTRTEDRVALRRAGTSALGLKPADLEGDGPLEVVLISGAPDSQGAPGGEGEA